MRIAVTRSGGVAGIRRHAEVDTARRGDADLWERLVREAGLAARTGPENAAPHQPAPDRFVYTIRVDQREVSVGEADLTEPLRELIDRVLSAGSPDREAGNDGGRDNC